MKLDLKYKQILAQHLNVSHEDVFLYWKGRIALYALLKAMKIGKDDEVILPAYTCVVVPNAILYLGAKPIYVDINLNTYNSDFEAVKMAITPKTKAIICQNTFGLSSDIEKLVELAKLNNLFTIEDCTHGFGGNYNDKPNGSYCDAAFYSTQWNKPFSSGIGGFSIINNQSLVEPLKTVNIDLIPPSFSQKFTLKILYFVKRYLLKGYTYWTLVKFYRFLSKHNLIVGSSSGGEISSIKQPENYFMSISDVQIKEGLRNLNYISKYLNFRIENANIYTDYLSKINKNHVPISLFKNHSFLKYPLLVSDRKHVIEIAEKYQIELGDWLNSPIHPVQENFDLWELNLNQFPNAVHAGKHMINLPTDTKNPQKVIEFLKIIDSYILNQKKDEIC